MGRLGRGFKTQILKPKTEIPKQVRDDKKTIAEPYCHAEPCAELVSVLFQHLIYFF